MRYRVRKFGTTWVVQQQIMIHDHEAWAYVTNTDTWEEAVAIVGVELQHGHPYFNIQPEVCS